MRGAVLAVLVLASNSWAYDTRSLISLPVKSISVLRDGVTNLVDRPSASSYASFTDGGEWVLVRHGDGRMGFKNLEGGFDLETFWGGLPEPNLKKSSRPEIFISPGSLLVKAPGGWNWSLRALDGEGLGNPVGRDETVWFGSHGRWALSQGEAGVRLWRLHGNLDSERLAAASILTPVSGLALSQKPLWKRLLLAWANVLHDSPLRFAVYLTPNHEILAVKGTRLHFKDVATGIPLKKAPIGQGGMLYSGLYEPQKGRLAISTWQSAAVFSGLAP